MPSARQRLRYGSRLGSSSCAASRAARIARRSASSGSGSICGSIGRSLKAESPTDDTSVGMTRRPILVLAASCCALVAVATATANVPPQPPGSASTPTTPSPPAKPAKPAPGTATAPAVSGASSWAAADIRAVVAAELMGPDIATFRPQDPLTRGALADLVAGLTQQPPQPVTNPDATVSMAALDSKLVRVEGLAPVAAEFAQAAYDAGLTPPTRFGTEVVARLLGLRFNHPAAHDDLELLPTDPATRAEAAYSAARILRFDGSEVQRATDAAATFALPDLGPWQTQVLQTAFSLVGFPYVWGGTSERAESPLASRLAGGSTAPASSGASTSSSRIQAPLRSRRPSAAERPTR